MPHPAEGSQDVQGYPNSVKTIVKGVLSVSGENSGGRPARCELEQLAREEVTVSEVAIYHICYRTLGSFSSQTWNPSCNQEPPESPSTQRTTCFPTSKQRRLVRRTASSWAHCLSTWGLMLSGLVAF